MSTKQEKLWIKHLDRSCHYAAFTFTRFGHRSHQNPSMLEWIWLTGLQYAQMICFCPLWWLWKMWPSRLLQRILMFFGESDQGGCHSLSNESVTQLTGATVCKWQFVIYHCHANDALLILPHYQCSRANCVACRHVCGTLYKVQVRAGAILDLILGWLWKSRR